MRRYTTEEKESALRLAEELGAPKAAEQLGISYATLLDWRKKASAMQMSINTMEASHASTMSDSAGTSDFALELKVRLLEQENAALRKQLARQAQAIHDLSPMEQ